MSDDLGLATYLDIVVVYYDAGKRIFGAVFKQHLVYLARAIRRAGINCHIHIVDNSQNLDEKQLEILKNYADIRLSIHKPQQNLGFARAVNLATRNGTSPYILSLNPDVILEQNALLHIRRFLNNKATPDLAGLGIKLQHQDPRLGCGISDATGPANNDRFFHIK